MLCRLRRLYAPRRETKGRGEGSACGTKGGRLIDAQGVQERDGGRPAAAAAVKQDGPPIASQTGGHRGRAVAALAGLALVWGYSWVVMKVGLQYADPFLFATLRMGLSALVLFMVMAALGRSLRPVAFWWTALIGLLQTTGFAGVTTAALAAGSAGKVSVLVYTMPFWLLLLAWLVLGERVRGVQWLAVALALVGFLLILSPWQLRGARATILAVCGGLLWAAGGVTMKALDRRRHVDLLSLTAWQLLLGSVPLVIIAAATWEAPIWSGSFLAALAYAVILGNALAWYLWSYSLRALPTGLAGFGTLAIPVLAVAAAWLQLGEVPGLYEAVGMACIIGALAVLTLTELARGRTPASPLPAAPAAGREVLPQ